MTEDFNYLFQYLEKEAIKLIKLNFYFKKKSHPEKKLYDQII